jgi:hypothetical protein
VVSGGRASSLATESSNPTTATSSGHDDQAVLLSVRDKGLVVLTGCGHAGIVNRTSKELSINVVTATGIYMSQRHPVHTAKIGPRHRPTDHDQVRASAACRIERSTGRRIRLVT